MYKRILVPLDGSTASAQALPFVRLFAEATGARIDLLQVIPTLATLMDDGAIGGYEGLHGDTAPTLNYDEWQEWHEHVRARAASRLAALRETIDLPGLQVETLIREGGPAESIVDESLQKPDTLIAMTAHGRSELGRWLVGSVTDKIVRHATAPVLVIRAQEEAGSAAPTRLQRIILPLDGSPLAEEAIPRAARLAMGFRVPVAVIRATPLAVYGYGFDDYSLPEDAKVYARAYLAQVADRLRRQGVSEVSTSVSDGNPAEVIVTMAENSPDSLVVMTTHGRSGVGRWLLGSVTDRVIHHGASPVLVLRSTVAAGPKPAVKELTEQQAGS